MQERIYYILSSLTNLETKDVFISIKIRKMFPESRKI